MLATPDRRRGAAIGFVALLHIVVFWVLVASVRAPHFAPANSELQVNLLSPNLGQKVAPAPPLDWTFAAPQEALVPEPEFAIAPDAAAQAGLVAGTMGQLMAPHPDPDYRNEPPKLPAELSGYAGTAVLVLRVLVLQDGTIAEAQIIKSSGEHTVDALGIAFVKDAWHFMPAVMNGKPVQNWTTVFVRFS